MTPPQKKKKKKKKRSDTHSFIVEESNKSTLMEPNYDGYKMVSILKVIVHLYIYIILKYQTFFLRENTTTGLLNISGMYINQAATSDKVPSGIFQRYRWRSARTFIQSIQVYDIPHKNQGPVFQSYRCR